MGNNNYEFSEAFNFVRSIFVSFTICVPLFSSRFVRHNADVHIVNKNHIIVLRIFCANRVISLFRATGQPKSTKYFEKPFKSQTTSKGNSQTELQR